MPTRNSNKGIKKLASKPLKPLRSSKSPKISSVQTAEKIFGAVKTSAGVKKTPSGKRVTFTSNQRAENKTVPDNKRTPVGGKNASIVKRPIKKILKKKIEESEEELENENEGLEGDQEFTDLEGKESEDEDLEEDQEGLDSGDDESENENLEEGQESLDSEEEELKSEISDDSKLDSDNSQKNSEKNVELTESGDDDDDDDDNGPLSLVGATEESEEPAAKRAKKENPNQGRIKAAFERKRKGDRKLDPKYTLGLKECWEFARKTDISPEERRKYLNELFELIDGVVPELLFKHDTSRIIQTGLKYGTKEQINKIASELEGRWLEASKSKYAKFVVLRIMQSCPRYRDKIVSELEGNVAKLLMHAEARSVILEAYELSNGKQRSSLIQEFYGPEFTLFKKTKGLGIDDLIAENPSNKDRIVENLSKSINNFMKKPELLGFIIPHRVLLDFFTYANETKIRSTIELIGKHVPEILHTREGAKVAMLCLSYASAKERKGILQSMKDYVEKICCEEYGYLVLLRAFDVIDDTVSVTKYIIDKMIKPNSFETISRDKYGHRVVLYLLTGRSKKYLSFDTLKLLAQGDEIREKTSKKDQAVRARELRKAITPALIEYSKNNTAHMLSNPYTTQILFETMLCGESSAGEKRPILENISEIISEKTRDSEDNIMLTYVNRFLKVLVQGGHRKYPERNTMKKDGLLECKETIISDHKEGDSNDEKVELHFARILFDTIKNDLLYYSCHVTASFVILSLLEDDETKDEVKSILSEGVDSIRKATLEDSRSGSSLILKALSESNLLEQKISVVDNEKKKGKKRKRHGDA